MSSSMVLRAVTLFITFFVMGLANAAPLLDARSSQHSKNSVLVEEPDASSKKSGRTEDWRDNSFHRYQSARDGLRAKPTSSKLVDEGRCYGKACLRGWMSASSDFGSSVPPSVINPVAAFRVTGEGGKGTAVTVRWRTPAPEGDFAPHNVAYYQVLLDYGDHYRIYQVEELVSLRHAQASAVSEPGAKGRVRQWLHVNDAGPRPPRVHVRPIVKTSELNGGELIGASTQAGSAAGGDEFGKPIRVGDVDFADINLAQCVARSGHSGNATLVSELAAVYCTGQNIQDLHGLQYLTALRILHLNQNPIQTIDNLGALLELEHLDLSGTNVLDFSVLRPENFAWLSALYLDSTNISYLSDIARLQSLHTLAIADTAVQAIPDLSATNLHELDISLSPISDLSGLTNAHTLHDLSFHGRRIQGPILQSSPYWRASGDLTPLISLAQHPDNSLAAVDLTDHQDFPCSQLSVLLDALQNQGVYVGELTSPASCLDLPILSAPVSSVTPSVGNLYTISWESEGATETPLYQLQQSREHVGLGSEDIIIDSNLTEVDFGSLAPREAGAYRYRVRACDDGQAPMVCTAWSQSIHHVVMDSAGIPGDQAIANVADPGFRSCLYDRLAYLDNGVLVYRLTGEISTLTCRSYKIASLQGIQQFPSLSGLSLYDNKLDDLSPLRPILQAAAQGDRSWGISLGNNLIQGTELGVFVEYGSDFINLHLQDNPLNDISDLAALSPLWGLTLSRTGITSLAPLQGVSIGSLRVSGNGISVLPPLEVGYEIQAADNQISDIHGLAGLGNTFSHLDLSRNPIGHINDYSPILAGLASLSNLNLHDTGIDNLGFVSSIPSLEHLTVSSNPISNLSPLTGHSGLKWLIANNTPISDLEPLRNALSLEYLHLYNTAVSNLGPLADASSLAVLKISGGDLSDPAALSPLQGLTRLFQLVVHDTGLSSVASIAEWLDDPSNGFRRRTNMTRIDVLREPGPTCREVRRIWDEGLLFSLEAGVTGGICQPDHLELQVALQELTNDYSVSWEPSIAPENYTGTSYYEISYSENGPSDAVLVTVPGASADSVSLTIDLPEGHEAIGFRGRACRDDGVCSDWSQDYYSVYPLQQPRDVTFEPVSQQIGWSYHPAHSFETLDGVYFEISPLFPMFGPVVVEASGSGPWAYMVTDPGDWPGRMLRIRACREAAPESECGPGIEIRMDEVPVDPTIPAPQGVTLTTIDSRSGKYRLSWQPVNDSRITHYQIRESTYTGNGTQDKLFSVEANQFAIQRFAVDSSAAYEVAACHRDRDNGDRCSEFIDVTDGSLVNPPTSYTLGAVDDLCWEHVEGLEEPAKETGR